MCRLIAYKGAPILLTKLLLEPKNSLVKQSFGAKEIDEPLNGDGFGVGWYAEDLTPQPAVFLSTTPAWSNRNLHSISSVIKAKCVFAHVRAASVGDTSESNCHPFSRDQFLLMHNGGIGGFPKIKRKLRRSLSDEVYNWLRGETDTQHFFGIFLDKIQKLGANYSPTEFSQCLVDTIEFIENMKLEANISEVSYLNVVVSDGRQITASRYISSATEDALSLYYSSGSRYICEEGVCRMVSADPSQHSALIVSEKLTDLTQDWQKVPNNHLVSILENGSVELRPIKINLQQNQTLTAI